jgi:hypothetical protein
MSNDDIVGRSLGSYRIIERLGAGGMATVYKAYQPSMDRYVAVKVLPRFFAQDPTFTGRFAQEAKVIARLEHARILPVYDYGEEDGITYIVMRYLDGGTLADRLRSGPLPLDEINRIISQIAEGLDYAHRKGVIHRDIKPSNIMLDQSGNAYLTDFGISKLAEGTAQFTGSGIVGTPAYVSPEQGLGQPVDYRTDIYSLGVVLYQMTTGDVPFRAETPMAVVIKHIYDPLPLPTSVNPSLPAAVEQVILWAMAKKPEERFQSCEELAAALRKACAQAAAPDDAHTLPAPAPLRPATAMPEGTVRAPEIKAEAAPEGKPKRRGRRLALSLIGVAAVLIVVLGGLLVLRRMRLARQQAQETPPPQPAVEQTEGGSAAVPAEEQAGEEGSAAVPAGEAFTCPSGTMPVLIADFEDGTAPFELPPGVQIITGAGGHHLLEMIPQGGEGSQIVFGPDISDALLIARVYFPASFENRVALAGRYGGEGGVGHYAAIFRSAQIGTLMRNDEELVEEPIPALNDRQMHGLALLIKGRRVEAWMDGQMRLSWEDPAPLPAGRFAFYTEDTVWIDTLAACRWESGEAAGSAGPLVEDFEDDQFVAGLAWLREPAGGWRIDGGRLFFDLTPGTFFETGLQAQPPDTLPPVLAILSPDLPSYTVQVDLKFAPDQNVQSAGLILLSQAQRALFRLGRAYCDTPDRCQGDAVYFENLTLRARPTADSRPRIAGAGQLPAEASISLRMVISGGVVQGFYSLDGQTWQMAGEWPLLVDERIGYVGLTADTAGRPVESIPVIFDNFTILPSMP